MSLLDLIECLPYEVLEKGNSLDIGAQFFPNPEAYNYPISFDEMPSIQVFKQELEARFIIEKIGNSVKLPDMGKQSNKIIFSNDYADFLAKCLFLVYHFSDLFLKFPRMTQIEEDLKILTRICKEEPSLVTYAGARILQNIAYTGYIDGNRFRLKALFELCARRRGFELHQLKSLCAKECQKLAQGLLHDIGKKGFRRGASGKNGLHWLVNQAIQNFNEFSSSSLRFEHQLGLVETSLKSIILANDNKMKKPWQVYRLFFTDLVSAMEQVSRSSSMSGATLGKLFGKLFGEKEDEADDTYIDESFKKLVRRTSADNIMTSTTIESLVEGNYSHSTEDNDLQRYEWNIDAWYPRSTAISNHYPDKSKVLTWLSKIMTKKYYSILHELDALPMTREHEREISFRKKTRMLLMVDDLLVKKFRKFGIDLEWFDSLSKIYLNPNCFDKQGLYLE